MLDDQEKKKIRDVLGTIARQRIRYRSRQEDLMKEAVELQHAEVELAYAYNELSSLLRLPDPPLAESATK